jgi:hypothetical protein
MCAQRCSTCSLMVLASCGVVSRSREPSTCSTAAAHPARLNTNTIAGSSAAASSRSTTSTRVGV